MKSIYEIKEELKSIREKSGIKHFLSISDLRRDELETILESVNEFRGIHKILRGKALAMFFEKPSTRTRVSFEVGMHELGGHALYIDCRTSQISRGETMGDTAKVMSRYVNGIMARVNRHEDLVEMARYSSIPIINGLSDLLHPCQILSDIYTIREMGIENPKVVWMGDGNNVCNSLMIAGKVFSNNMEVLVCTPEQFKPNQEIMKGTKTPWNPVPEEAVKDADIIYTDTWVSMGDKNTEERLRALRPYQVNSELIKHASPNAKVMHCLPAHRNHEITSEVMDGPHSLVFRQAENRLHVQKALLVYLLQAG